MGTKTINKDYLDRVTCVCVCVYVCLFVEGFQTSVAVGFITVFQKKCCQVSYHEVLQDLGPLRGLGFIWPCPGFRSLAGVFRVSGVRFTAPNP